MTAEPSGSVQSIARALTLLEALGEGTGEVGIVELSRRVSLHVSTVHRILATLAARGYVRQNTDTGRYSLGARVFHLAESYLSQLDLLRGVRPVLERLSRNTGETSNLVILDGREALYLDKVESPQNLRIFSRIGRRAPLYCTAVGKVLLAGRSVADVETLIGREPLQALTNQTVTSVPQLRRELEKIREQGFATDREECEEGACCIAAPVRNARGEVVAAVSLSGPTIRMQVRRVQELVPLVVAAAREGSAQLGHRQHEAERVAR
jgi:DNA-binding IclR family transcriptional regulator